MNFDQNKQGDETKSSLFNIQPATLDTKKESAPVSKPLFGGENTLFNNAFAKPAEDQTKTTPVIPPTQTAESKPMNSMFNNQPKDNGAPLATGAFKIDGGAGIGLFDSKPSEPIKTGSLFGNPNVNLDTSIAPATQEKPNGFEEEQEASQNKSRPLFGGNTQAFPTTPIQTNNMYNTNPTSAFVPPFGQTGVTIPPNENPLYKPDTSFNNSSNGGNNFFPQGQSPAPAQPNQADAQLKNPFLAPNMFNNSNSSPITNKVDNPFMMMPGSKSDKSPNSFANSKSPSIYKSNTSKNADPLSQRVNDIKTPPMGQNALQNITQGQGGSLFGNPGQGLFNSAPGLFGNQNSSGGLFNNNNSSRQ